MRLIYYHWDASCEPSWRSRDVLRGWCFLLSCHCRCRWDPPGAVRRVSSISWRKGYPRRTSRVRYTWTAAPCPSRSSARWALCSRFGYSSHDAYHKRKDNTREVVVRVLLFRFLCTRPIRESQLSALSKPCSMQHIRWFSCERQDTSLNAFETCFGLTSLFSEL